VRAMMKERRVVSSICSGRLLFLVLGGPCPRQQTYKARSAAQAPLGRDSRASWRKRQRSCTRLTCASAVLTGRRCRPQCKNLSGARGHRQHTAPLRCVRACKRCAACHYRMRRPSDWLCTALAFAHPRDGLFGSCQRGPLLRPLLHLHSLL
jgi:hypothetical protein